MTPNSKDSMTNSTDNTIIPEGTNVELEQPTIQPPRMNRKGRRMTKSVAGRWRRGPKKRPAWMNYCVDVHEAVIWKKVAGELNISVPSLLRQSTNKMINEALDSYKEANPKEFESKETENESGE